MSWDGFMISLGITCAVFLAIFAYAIVLALIDERRRRHDGPRGRGFTE